MKKKNKIIITIIGIICVIIVGILISVTQSAKNTANNIIIQTADMFGIADGTYEGRYEVLPVKVAVRVTVANAKITDVVILEHENGFGGKAEFITDAVISEQTLDVDTISGASVSSKAILKAIEDALNSGR